MASLQSNGRIFYGLGVAGIGALHFFFAGFRPVIIPIPPEATQHLNYLVYFTGTLLVFAGLAIAMNIQVKAISLLLGTLLLLFLLFGHLPNRFANHPDSLGAWTDALKIFALAGGAYVVSKLYPDQHSNALLSFVERLAYYGKYFFALTLIVFGIDHFVYTDFVKTLVPAWIPLTSLFWTYFAGIALIGSGLAIFIDFKPKLISTLLDIMLFLWLILLHIPRALASNITDNGNEWTSVFECLAFIGIAILYPYSKRRKASTSPLSAG